MTAALFTMVAIATVLAGVLAAGVSLLHRRDRCRQPVSDGGFHVRRR